MPKELDFDKIKISYLRAWRRRSWSHFHLNFFRPSEADARSEFHWLVKRRICVCQLCNGETWYTLLKCRRCDTMMRPDSAEEITILFERRLQTSVRYSVPSDAVARSCCIRRGWLDIVPGFSLSIYDRIKRIAPYSSRFMSPGFSCILSDMKAFRRSNFLLRDLRNSRKTESVPLIKKWSIVFNVTRMTLPSEYSW